MARHRAETNEELVLLTLEVALSQGERQRLRQSSQRMRFVATGSSEAEHTAEVLPVASEQTSQPPHSALLTRLLLPGRTPRVLLYVIETDNPGDMIEWVAPFGGLVQWDMAPAIDVNEAQPTPESAAGERSSSFLSL